MLPRETAAPIVPRAPTCHRRQDSRSPMTGRPLRARRRYIRPRGRYSQRLPLRFSLPTQWKLLCAARWLRARQRRGRDPHRGVPRSQPPGLPLALRSRRRGAPPRTSGQPLHLPRTGAAGELPDPPGEARALPQLALLAGAARRPQRTARSAPLLSRDPHARPERPVDWRGRAASRPRVTRPLVESERLPRNRPQLGRKSPQPDADCSQGGRGVKRSSMKSTKARTFGAM